MELLKWFFSVRGRHSGGIRRYHKGGVGVRLFTIFLIAAFAGAVLGLEYWAASATKEFTNLGVVIISWILFAVFAGALMEFAGVYAVTAIVSCIRGTAEQAAYRADKKRAARAAQAEQAAQAALQEPIFAEEAEACTADGAGMGAGEAQPAGDVSAAESGNEARPKSYRALDLVVFLFALAVAIGTVAACFALGLRWLAA